MTQPITVCLAGASGLVGRELMQILAHVEGIAKIIALTRSPLGKIPPHVDNLIVNFDQIENHSHSLHADIFVCCLGTTLKKAGSKKEFERVDFDYALKFAKVAESVGAKKLLIITSMGADSESFFFYNRVKGQIENAVKKLAIPQIEIFRPSLIIGNRKEQRLAEEWAQKFSPVFNALCIGPLQKYRSITATDIAKAMAIASMNYNVGLFVYSSDEIQKIASGLNSSIS